MIAWLSDPAIWASFITLTAMEIVLGIDNIIFISVVVSNLPARSRAVARQIGLGLALLFRVLLLLGITWVISWREPVLSLFGQAFSWRDIILLAGGLFLLMKATIEIHKDIEEAGYQAMSSTSSGFFYVIMQIVVIDMIFSIDSIITAIGIAEHVEVMIAAVVLSMIVMYYAATAIGSFIERHPTTKMLALSFLILIGAALVADGLQFHIPRGYIYFAMAFAAMVEFFNIAARGQRKNIKAERS